MSSMSSPTAADVGSPGRAPDSTAAYFPRRLRYADPKGEVRFIGEGGLLVVPGPKIVLGEPGMGKSELVREAGATPLLLNDAISASLIQPAERFPQEALTVLKALVELQRTGIEPRHLRGYRASAERESVIWLCADLTIMEGSGRGRRAIRESTCA